jgi:serine beta-lactamase-like protein LACTB, mitochondrial
MRHALAATIKARHKDCGSRRACLLLFLLWTASSFAKAPIPQPLAPEKAAAIDAAVQAEMQKEQVVGMAIGIIEKGQLEYLKGYGLADREKNIPVTTDTMFRWASCTKPLAAIAALQLAEKGQLDLDADVRKYVPEFPDKGVIITSREILCHQSGIVHYSNGKVIPTKRKYNTPHPYTDPVVSLDHFKESPLLFKPGEKVSYSSYAYLLLSAVVERAGKQKFADQVAGRIAKSLDLTTLQPDYQWVNIANRAAGYRLEKGQVVLSTNTDQSWKWGGGAYISTIGDFTGFAQGLINGKLVNKETETRMWEPQKTSDGKTTDRGLGFELRIKDGQLIQVFHDGKQEKTRTDFVIYPRKNNSVIVMTNSEWVNPYTFSTLIYNTLTKPQ